MKERKKKERRKEEGRKKENPLKARAAELYGPSLASSRVHRALPLLEYSPPPLTHSLPPCPSTSHRDAVKINADCCAAAVVTAAAALATVAAADVAAAALLLSLLLLLLLYCCSCCCYRYCYAVVVAAAAIGAARTGIHFPFSSLNSIDVQLH